MGILAATVIPAVIVLPGWVLLPFVVRKSSVRLLHAAFLIPYLSLLSLSLLSLLALALGLFRPWPVCLCLLGFTAVAAALTRGRHPRIQVASRWDLAVATLGVCAGLALSLWGSSEIALGGRDPGTYLASGAVLREGAGVSFKDSLWQSLSRERRDTFTHWDHGIPQRHPGFYLHGQDREMVKLEVLPLYPCWEAIALELAGLTGAMRLNTYLGLLSLLAMAVAALALGGPAAALLAPLFLGTCLPQIYFSRIPSADIAAQALVLGALASYTILRSPSRGAVVSGLGLGLTFFTHVSAWVLTPGILGCALLWARDVRWGWLATILPLAGISAADMVLHRWEYVTSRLAKVHLGWESPLLFGALALLGIGATLVSARGGRRGATSVRTALATVLLAFVAWGYCLRPELVRSIHTGGKVLPNWDRYALRWAGSYASPLVLLMGVVETVRRLAKTVGRGALVPAVLAPHLVVFGYRQLVHPDHPWAARRFLVAVFPLIGLMAAVLLGRLWDTRHCRAYAAVAVGGCAAVWWLVSTSAPVLGLREEAGTLEKLKRLTARFEPLDVVVVEGSRVGYLVSVPLQYLFQTPVLLYTPEQIGDASVLTDAVGQWIREGRETYYLSPWPAGPTPFGGVAVQWLDHVTLSTIQPRTNWTGPPRGRESLSLSLYVHRFSRAETPTPTSYASLNIGEDDFGRVEGFYGPEVGAGSGEAYRWTGPRAKVLFPTLASSGPFKLTMRLSAPRARGGNPAVKLYVSENLVAELNPGPEWMEYVATVPRVDPTKATVVIESEVWNPLHSEFSTDDRFLGVRVDWARFEEAQ